MISSIAPFQLVQAPEVVERVYGARVELGHGGEPVDSLMMHLRPDRVKISRAGAWGRRRVFGCPTGGLGAIRIEGMRVAVPLDMEDVAPPETGSLSDPHLGTPERGRPRVMRVPRLKRAWVGEIGRTSRGVGLRAYSGYPCGSSAATRLPLAASAVATSIDRS